MEEITQDDILQMSGRAGRRGHDTSGNVIYYNISDYSKYRETSTPKADDACKFTDLKCMKDKFHRELKLNYKDALVTKYTKELITKLDMFD